MFSIDELNPKLDFGFSYSLWLLTGEARNFKQRLKISKRLKLELDKLKTVKPRSRGYGDVTVTYIRRSEIPSCIYAKHQ